jgi:hypothetical protein
VPVAFEFVPSSTPGLYYGQTAIPFGAATVNRVDRKAAWIPLAFAEATPVNHTLDDAWGKGPGAFLFLGQSLRKETDFAAGVRKLLREPPLENARLLWLANPNDRRDQWRVTALRLDVNGTDTAVCAATGFTFGYYEVVVAPGCRVTIESAEARFRFQASPHGAIFLTARNGADRLDVVTGDLTISLAGDVPGRLEFPLAGGAALDGLDIALRLFYPTDFLGARILNSLRYPVFDLSQQGIALKASLDPLAPDDGSRTSFAFQPGAEVPSFYRTNVGRTVSFRFPNDAAGRLVFSRRPLFPTATARDSLSLAPDGPFAIAAPGNPPNLLCGVNGGEFVELDGHSTLTFAAGQPGFLPAVPASAGANVVADVRLSALTTTSWAAAGSTESRLCYSAVPEGAGYYGDATGNARLRPYFAACAAFLPKASEAAGASGAYPLLPYAGIQADDFSLYQLVETRILSPVRRELIHRINAGLEPARTDSTAVTTVTPQGLMAEFSQDRATWTTLKAAQTSAGLLAFHSIRDPLRSALLTNQQFLVITDPGSLDPFFATDNVADIEGWKFLLDPAGWNRFGTILIVKNHNHTLRELVDDLSLWTLATNFNSSPGQARERIQAIIQSATSGFNSTEAPNPDYEYFVKTVVDDERWNGLLFLNAGISVTGLPPDLEVLAAGIDPAKFVAQHFGINQTPVTDDGEMKSSSLFGLIDYQDPAALETSFAEFDFRVGVLRALFHNSVVKSFSAKAALTLRRLFGAPAAQADGDSLLLLDGMYEKHGDGQAFALTQETPAVFTTADAVLKQVRIAKTHCSTSLPATASADPVESVFAFWGDLGFQELKLDDGTSFDLFSYDGLSFSNLRLTMAYSQADPTQRTFTFDPGGMSFDAAGSVARENSLARHFPVKIKSLLVSNAADPNSHPVASGYLAVGLPLDIRALTSPSFGLEFDLNLGTLGALASSAGFGATLALAWSPATSLGPVFAGLKAPLFSGGENQASLMGVVKMKMHSVELVSSGGAFMLMINGIALSFFGKTLPPGGTFDFLVFGDPNPKPGAGTLGWYGDFKKSPQP